MACSCGGADYAAGKPLPSQVESAHLQPFAARLLLIGDSHVQYLHGEGIVERTRVADRASYTAIRPVQLDMFGHQLLLDACRAVPDVPILHVGDVANTACTQELTRSFELMHQCGQTRPWVMAPGNHDAFLMGSLDREAPMEEWERACRAVGQPQRPETRLTKAELLRRYLVEVWEPASTGGAALECQSPPGASGWARCQDGAWHRAEPSTSGSSCGTTPPNSGSAHSRLVEVDFHIDTNARWESYVVQIMDLSTTPGCPPAVYGLLLDTIHYGSPPKLLPSDRDPGSTGSIDGPQRDVVRDLVARYPDAWFLLVGHHPLIKMQPDSREFVLELAENPRVLAYLSGHTHAGRWYAHRIDGRPGEFIELNVGSILDHPNEYRDVQLLATGPVERPTAVYLQSETTPGRQRPVCRDSFYSSPELYVDYRSGRLFSPVELQRHLLYSQAKAWIHFLQHAGLHDSAKQKALVTSLTDAGRGRRSGANDERLRSVLQRATESVRTDMEGHDPGDPTLLQQQDYQRCVAYRAARYEGGVSERVLQRRISCTTPLDLDATSDPFTHAVDTFRLTPIASDAPEARHGRD